MPRLKHQKFVPIDSEGNQFGWMTDKDFKLLAPIAGRRTHKLGLEAGVGNITVKEALQAAYIQGLTDLHLSQNGGEL